MLILRNEIDLQALEKISYSNNWITILLLFLFLIIVVLKRIDEKRLKRSFLAIFNVNYIEEDINENPSFFNVFNSLMFLFSSIVLSIFFFEFKLFKLEVFEKNFSSFFIFFIYVLSYLLIKKTIEYLLSLLFLIKDQTYFYSKSIFYYLNSLAFILFAVLLIHVFSPINPMIVFAFSAILFAIRFILILLNNKKLIFNKLFYFILYFCAFEIAPLFLLYKLMF